MSNENTIPSQLSPIDTMPSQLGQVAGDLRARKAAPASRWTRVLLIALAGIVVVYLVRIATGS